MKQRVDDGMVGAKRYELRYAGGYWLPEVTESLSV